MTASASVSTLLQYLQAAEQRGADRKPLLAAAGVDESLLPQRERRITLDQLERFIDAAVAATGDALFGLHTAQFVTPATYNVLGYIAMNSATLGDAIGKIDQYEKLVGDMGTTSISRQGAYTQLTWNCVLQSSMARRHVIENVLGSWVAYARWIAGAERAPIKILLEHDHDPDTDIAEYSRHFGCDIVFVAGINAVVFDSELLDYPLAQSNQTLLQLLEQHAERELAQLAEHDDFPARVRVAMLRALEQGQISKHEIATALHVSERSLHRHLARHGHGFQDMLDDIRIELAKRYLRDASIPMTVVTQSLGFAEDRSFFRFFRNKTGVTPAQFRAGADGRGIRG
jgi:AraC-like DNA-binding protein